MLPKLRVLYNDSHANLPHSSSIAQGGPGRFAQLFTEHMTIDAPDIELVSVLFSYTNSDDVHIRETTGDHVYHEILYPRQKLVATYTTTHHTRTSYISFLAPWLAAADSVITSANPDIVFLNGFNLSNWILLEAAHRRGIPICIQHAGIWKKELSVSQDSFDHSIREIFESFEKDIVTKATLQIFLNEYSRDVFFREYTILQTPEAIARTVIIPLPVETDFSKSLLLQPKNNTGVSIGVVARWDSIKNHAAILRLATYIKEHDSAMALNVVTAWPTTLQSTFKSTYEASVAIVPPMNSADLAMFFAAQDVLIVPSVFDVSPTVVMEALMAGTPVIISENVGWVSDYRIYGLERMVIDPNATGETIHGTIVELFDNPQLYLPRFQKLQEKIRTEHAASVVFQTYRKAFKHISAQS